jgi:hypothetical protein
MVIIRRLLSVKPSASDATVPYSMKEALVRFQPWAQSVSVMFAGLGAFGAIVYYVSETRNKVELAKAQAKAHVDVVKAQVDVVKAQAKADVAEAENRTAQKFLLYGYAEEYHRFQEKTIPKPKPKPE